MTKVRRVQINALIECGYGIAVEYAHPNQVQVGIQHFSHGRAAHFLCCLGGFKIVEEDVGGCMETDLDNYLRGNCTLKIYRVRPHLNASEQTLIREYWLGEVGTGYGFGSVMRAAVATPIRRYVVPRFPSIGHVILRVLSRMMGHQKADCSALWAFGIKRFRTSFLPLWDAEDVMPETIVRHTGRVIELVATLNNPILVEEDR